MPSRNPYEGILGKVLAHSDSVGMDRPREGVMTKAETLLKMTNDLGCRIEVLEGKLSPILRERSPHVMTETLKGPNPSEGSSVMNLLQGVQEEILQLGSKIEDLTKRVDL